MTADTLQFQRRLKEILKQPQICIEGIECQLSFQGLVPIPAHELAHMRPILLFPLCQDRCRV